MNARARSRPEPPQLVVPRFRLGDAGGDRIRVERVDEHGRAAGHLLGGTAARRDDRRPTRHRLDHRQPEPLVERREHEAPRAAVERRQLLVVDAPGPAGHLDPTPARRSHDPQLDARPLRRLDRAAEVLARLERSHREHVVSRRLRPRLGEHRLEPVRDDVDALGGNVEQLDELVARERRDGDDRVGALDPVAERDATRVPVPGREGLGVPEQGAVVDRDDHRKLRAQRPAHRRAMEHVRRPRLVGDAERVPREVADDGRRAPVTVEADRQDLELRPALESAREALHDAGRAGARLGERGDVERDLHRAAS